MSTRDDVRRSRLLVPASLGALWGFSGYALLWGYTSVVVQRPFVISPLGTVLLLPVRIVLWAIHAVEAARNVTFDFSENNWWIGAAAALVGGLVVAAATWVALWILGAIRSRRSGGEELPQPGQRI